MISRAFVCALAFVTVCALAAPIGAVVQSSRLGAQLGEFRVEAPGQKADLVDSVRTIVAEVGLQAGFELGAEHRALRSSRSDRNFMLVLDGLTAQEALDRILADYPEYGWTLAGSVVVVRPRGGQKGWLDQDIPQFSFTGNAFDALAAVRRLFDPAFTVRRRPSILDRPDIALTAIQQENKRDMSRPVHVSLKTGCVIDILNAIVASHGSLSWIVEYGDMSRSHQSARISLAGLTRQWQLSLDAQKLGRPLP